MSQINNVILLSVDDWRADCLGCEKDKRLLARYGADKFIHTPNLDFYAQAGIRFTNCYTVSSITPPSHASMLTGMYPEKHGIDTFFEKLAPQVQSLSEILSDAGFTTFAKTEQVSLNMLDVVRGFSIVDDHSRSGENIWDMIRKNRRKKNFVFLHVFDVHKPYYFTTGREESTIFNDDYLDKIRALTLRYQIDLDELLQRAELEARQIVINFDKLSPYLQNSAIYRSLSFFLRQELQDRNVFLPEIIRLYGEGVSKFDRGKFPWMISHLQRLGLTENSLLIITSDHGEAPMTMEGTQRFGNSHSISEGHARVPLIFYCPQLFEHRNPIDDEVSLVDVAPTVLDALGIEVSNIDFDGRSLWPAISYGEKIEERPCFLRIWNYAGSLDPFGNISPSSTKFVRQRGVVHRGYKFVEMGSPMLSGDIGNMTDIEFVKELYPRVTGRFGGIYEMTYWIRLLRDGFLSRFELLNRFKAHMESIGQWKILYDVREDPFEEHNLINDTSFQETAAGLQDKLSKCFGQGATVGGTELSKEEQHAVEDRLRALGYL